MSKDLSPEQMDQMAAAYRQRLMEHNKLPNAPQRSPEEIEQIVQNFRAILDGVNLPEDQRAAFIKEKMEEVRRAAGSNE